MTQELVWKAWTGIYESKFEIFDSTFDHYVDVQITF